MTALADLRACYTAAVFFGAACNDIRLRMAFLSLKYFEHILFAKLIGFFLARKAHVHLDDSSVKFSNVVHVRNRVMMLVILPLLD